MNKKIIDSFIFYNEFALLNMRLHELDDFVDYFVLVEATKTISGNSKPLFYDENKHLFERFQNKIMHVVVDDMPSVDNSLRGAAHPRERHQRSRIVAGVDLVPDIHGEDIVLVSDVDEIPNTRWLWKYLEHFDENPFRVFDQRFFYYNFSCEDPDGWKGTMSFPYEALKDIDLSNIRRDRFRKKDKRISALPDGGWHCSYFGGAEKIIDKLEQFSHQEFNTAKYKDKEVIEKLIRNKEDLFFRKNQSWKSNDEDRDKNLPKYKELAYGNV